MGVDRLKAFATAPGKVILTGEHFVVYGKPALVVAIDRRVAVKVVERGDKLIRVTSDAGVGGVFDGDSFRIKKGGPETWVFLEPIRIAAAAVMNRVGTWRGLDIEVQSAIPIAAGLGSSSATSVATVAAVGKIVGENLSQEDIVDLALTAEKFVHVNPSGVDPAVSTYGGLILYRREEGSKRLQLESNLPLVIGNTGLSRNTGNLVKAVKERRDRMPEVVDPLIRLAGTLTLEGVKALKAGDMVLFGELMNVNQGFLTAVGVSNETLDRLIYAARLAGALGAKLTGAGGGGCMIALSSRDTQKRIAEEIRRAGGAPIVAETVETGVQVWSEN